MKTLIVIGILLVCLVLFAGIAWDWGRTVPPINDMPNIIAHRGASGFAPENTLAAIHLALEKGANMIEIDVHLTHDHEVVVIHDPTIDRTSDGVGTVFHHTLEELKTLDFGSWFGPPFVGEKIPTLREALAAVDGKAIMLIEIKKGEEGLYEGIEEAIIDIVDKAGAREWTIFQSFEPEVVKRMFELAPEMEHHKLIYGGLPFLSFYYDGKPRKDPLWDFEGVQAITPYYKTLTPHFVNSAHRNGIKVFTYTVDNPKHMRRMLKLKVDGIITNYPGRLKKIADPFNAIQVE